MARAKGKSRVLTSSGVISTASKPCRIRSISLIAGTTASSIIILDGGSGGTERWRLTAKAQTAAGDLDICHTFGPDGLICTTDAYGTLAGTNAVACIEYEELA